MKKILSVLFCTVITLVGVNATSDDVEKAINDTAHYLYAAVPSPRVGSVGGEWAILGLARGNAEIPENYYHNYYNTVENYVVSKGGILHDKKYTEYSRVVLSLTAIGKNPENVAGYNLITPLLDFDKTVRQGINGAVWALIALDSADYGTAEIREKYINHILEREITDGGFAMAATSETAEADITAMAITALSKYRERSDVAAVIERAIDKLSEMQTSSGGFASYGQETSESTSQVLVALCSVGISPDDARFVKNGNTLIANLLSYRTEDGAFAHTDTANLMATEQAFYALVAVERYKNNKNSLFDMSDRPRVGLPAKNPDVNVASPIYVGKTFGDIQNHKNKTAVEALARRGIVNGTSDTTFTPNGQVTRAEFAAIVVRALGLRFKNAEKFSDVAKSDWFCDYVNTAYKYGIVGGISETLFNPHGTITREEAAVMIARAAALCGMNTEMNLFDAKIALAKFGDCIKISDWAFTAAAFCREQGILAETNIEFKPQEPVTRAETAQMIYNMLRKAELI